MSTGILCSSPISANVLPPQDLCGHTGFMWQDKLELSRRAAGFSSNRVADELGVHPNTARNYMRGKARGGTDPSPEVLWQLCQMFGVSADWVLDDTQAALVGERPTQDSPTLLRELSPPPPRASVRKTNADRKRPEPPAAEASGKRGGPPSPRPARRDKKI